MALECREAVILYRHSYISDEQIENDCVLMGKNGYSER